MAANGNGCACETVSGQVFPVWWRVSLLLDSEALLIDNRYRFSHFDMYANKHNKHVVFADLTDFSLVTVPM